jgi:hypothetical protein
MTVFTVHASKNDQRITTVRIGPMVSIEKAKTLLQEGWQVHVTDAAGHQYSPDDFDQLVSLLNGVVAEFQFPETASLD